jgi:catechol 2,3-dioxygenase-like lactoylglutathione lyase family enzyme
MCTGLLELEGALRDYSLGFDPTALAGAQLAVVVERAGRMEKMAAAVKASAAARAAELGAWEGEGHPSAAHALAKKTGTSVRQAEDAITTAKQRGTLTRRRGRPRCDRGFARQNRMTIERVAMVTVQVRDFDAAVAWYRDVLGLEAAYIEPDEFCMLSTARGETVLALATDHPDRISDRPGVGWTPSLSVDDLDATVARLRQVGVEFDAEEEGADEGYRLVRVRDPEGNAIGLTTS